MNILLAPDTTYEGLIVVNCPGYKINFNTKNLDANTQYDDSPYCSANNNATISGGIVNNGGIVKIYNIDFVANENYKTSYNSSSVTAGLCASMIFSGNGDVMGKMSDIYHVYHCSFSGYDYAILSSGMGLVSGINNCRFEDNDVAICIESQMNNYYSDSRFNTFITDTNETAIYLKRRPQQSSALQLVYADNWFFGTGTDYIMGVGEYNSGIHFFINS